MTEQSIPVSIDTCGSNYDTEVGVFILVNGNLQLQISNDDTSFCFGGGTQSRVIFTFEAGVEYFIVVDGFGSGSIGDFNLNIEVLPSPSPPPPPFPPPPPAPLGTWHRLPLSRVCSPMLGDASCICCDCRQGTVPPPRSLSRIFRFRLLATRPVSSAM